MKTQKLELFIGLFVLAGLALLAFLIVFFGRIVHFGRQYYEVSAVFSNVRGMAPGTPVRHLGIDVGQLKATGFTQTPDKVKLVLTISKDHNIPADAKLSMRPEGILGDYYLEFTGGTVEAGFLPKDGSASIHGETVITFDEVGAQIADFATRLQKTLDSVGDNLTVLAGSLTKLLSSEEFQRDLRRTAAEAPEAIKSFRTMSERITQASDQAQDLVKQSQDLVGRMKQLTERADVQLAHQGENLDKLTERLVRSTDAFNETFASLDEILKRFEQGKGSIGALIQKDELHEKLVKTLDEMNEALEEIRKMAESIRRRWGG
jgi:phospholipid/cholesterol/gamma-HCH transport system substrate-binding protein